VLTAAGWLVARDELWEIAEPLIPSVQAALHRKLLQRLNAVGLDDWSTAVVDVGKRRTSPITATSVAAVTTSTPGSS
jgi:hypothetical protein